MGIAHELITRGWHQGNYEADDGAVCIAGASEYALFGECKSARNGLWGDDEEDARRSAEAIARAAGLAVTMQIGAWNDDPSRSFDEVLRVAKEADEILDGI